jgi:hypothetical protein
VNELEIFAEVPQARTRRCSMPGSSPRGTIEFELKLLLESSEAG